LCLRSTSCVSDPRLVSQIHVLVDLRSMSCVSDPRLCGSQIYVLRLRSTSWWISDPRLVSQIHVLVDLRSTPWWISDPHLGGSQSAIATRVQYNTVLYRPISSPQNHGFCLFAKAPGHNDLSRVKEMQAGRTIQPPWFPWFDLLRLTFPPYYFRVALVLATVGRRVDRLSPFFLDPPPPARSLRRSSPPRYPHPSSSSA